MNREATLFRSILLMAACVMLVACQQMQEQRDVGTATSAAESTPKLVPSPTAEPVHTAVPTPPAETPEPTAPVEPDNASAPAAAPHARDDSQFAIVNYDDETPPAAAEDEAEEPPLTYRIAFVAKPDDNGDIFAINADGSNVTRLTDDPAQDSFPLWSPDGQHLAFISDRYGSSELLLLDVDSGDLRRLTEGYDVNFLTWSPDSRSLAFTSFHGGNQDLYVLDLNDEEPRPIAASEHTEAMPHWSSTGAKIAFVTIMEHMGTLNSIAPDGSAMETLFSTDSIAMYLPQWSPDGGNVVFTGERDGAGDVRLYRGATGRVANLTNSPSPDDIDLGAWSADGQTIVFYSVDDSGTDIYSVDVSGNQVVRLTDAPGIDSVPSYSPDGQLIAFVSEREGYTEEAGEAPFVMYIMDADGSNQHKLVDLPAINEYVWSPLMKPLPEDPTQKLFMLNLEADKLYDAGQYAEASIRYDEMLPLAQALDDQAAIELILVNWGDVRAKTGDLAGAVADFEAALAFGQEDAVIYNNLCWWYGLLDEAAKALPYCDQAIALDPQATYHDSRGMVRALLGDFEGAAADFQLVIDDLAPLSDAEMNELRAERSIWLAMLRSEQSPFLPEVLESLQLNNPYARILPEEAIVDMPLLQALNHFWQGRDFFNSQQFESAVDEYSLAIEIYPEFDDAYYFRGIAYRFVSEPELAIADYSQAVALNPLNAPAYHLRGLTYGTLGDYEQAIADYGEAIAIDPARPEYYQITGGDLVALGRPAEAVPYFDKALELDPDYLLALWGRGEAYNSIGETELAIADLQKAFDLGLADAGFPPEMVEETRQLLDSLRSGEPSAVPASEAASSTQLGMLEAANLGLPSGFVAAPPEDFGVAAGDEAYADWNDDGQRWTFNVEDSFAFVNEESGSQEFMYGYIFTLADEEEIAIVDKGIAELEENVESDLRASDFTVVAVKKVSGLEGIGDSASGVSAELAVDGTPVGHYTVMFRSGDIVGVVDQFRLGALEGSVPIQELARAMYIHVTSP